MIGLAMLVWMGACFVGKCNGWVWCDSCSGRGELVNNFGLDCKGILVPCAVCGGDGFWSEKGREKKDGFGDDSGDGKG